MDLDEQLLTDTPSDAELESAIDASTLEASISGETPTPPAATDETPPEPAPRPKSGGMIPRHRYNYAAQKRHEAEAHARELEQRLQEAEAKLQQQQQPASPQEMLPRIENRISELDEEIEKARLDGDLAQIRKLRADQRFLERQSVLIEQQAKAPQVDPQALVRQATETVKVESVIADLESLYPMLEEGNALFNAEMSDEVMDAFEAFVKKMPRPQALQRAAAYVMAAHGIQPMSNVARRTTDKVKNVKAAAAIPPDLASVGLDTNRGGPSRVADVMKMTQDEFEKLGRAEIEKLLV